MHDDSGQTMPEFLEPANQCPSHKARVSIRFRFSREKADLFFFWGGEPFSDRVATTFQTGFEWFYRLMTHWPRTAHPTPMSTNTPGPSSKVMGFVKSNRKFCTKWVCLSVSHKEKNKWLEKGYNQDSFKLYETVFFLVPCALPIRAHTQRGALKWPFCFRSESLMHPFPSCKSPFCVFGKESSALVFLFFHCVMPLSHFSRRRAQLCRHNTLIW